MRKVVIYNTSGSTKMEISSSATTWGELKFDLTENGVNYTDMSVILGGSHVSLESESAELPTGDFKIFLSPNKVKSGASRSVLYAAMRQIKQHCSAKVKEAIGNYTQKSNEELERLLKKYNPGTKAAKEVRKYNTPNRDVKNRENTKIKLSPSNNTSPLSNAEIKERFLEIEYKLGIVNKYNKGQYSKKELDELNKEWLKIKSSLKR